MLTFSPTFGLDSLTVTFVTTMSGDPVGAGAGSVVDPSLDSPDSLVGSGVVSGSVSSEVSFPSSAESVSVSAAVTPTANCESPGDDDS